jgi:hypothetical protein
MTLDLVLEPCDYMVSNDDGDCVPGIIDHGGKTGWRFGLLFMKKFITIYDIKNNKLGFVRAEQNKKIE